MTYDFVKIGRRIAGERARKGWNQTELINQLSQLGVRISRNTFSKLESGKLDETNIPVDLIIGLCELFGCEAGYLLGEEGYRGKTRSATDVSKVTGLDAEAIEGLKQIYKGEIDGVLSYLVNGEYDDFYRPRNSIDTYDATAVVNWLFKNNNFKDFLFYLAYKLQTVNYEYVYLPDFERAIKSIFEDYHNENMPMLKMVYDGIPVADLVIPNEWNKLVKELNIRPEDEEHAGKVVSDYLVAMLKVLPKDYGKDK